MFHSLEVDIRPGLGLGMFEIGSSLWNVLDYLRTMQHAFPQVDVKFDPDTATTPVILYIRPHLELLFSGYHQRLHTICLKKLRDPNPPVKLTYNDAVLSSKEEVLRRVGVSRNFGPTYPGEDLRYPGVSFSFEEEGRADGLKSPTTSSDDKMQEVKRVLITSKNVDGRPSDALDEVSENSVMAGDVKRAIARVHDGVTLHFYSSNAIPVRAQLGITSAQDLVCELGQPLRIFYKQDNRMAIHSRVNKDACESYSDYFYNYLQHGVDFLMDGSTHLVKKIILHSNVPGTALFQRYKRCPWEIEGKPEDDEDESPPLVRFSDRAENISHFLSPKDSPPSMVLDRTDEEDGLTLPSAMTRLLGYDGIILEVTESSQVVAVMLF